MTAERPRSWSDDELGAAIAASRPEWPRTPPIAPSVVERIRETERLPQLRPRMSLPSRRRTVLILVAAVLLLAAAAVAATVIVRIGAETVRVLPGPPTAEPTRTLSPGALGEPVTLSEAEEVAGFAPVVPARLGEPDGVWVDAPPPGTTGAEAGSRIVLAWAPTPALPAIGDLPWGAVVLEFRGQAEIAAKTVFEDGGGSIRGVSVDGHEGLWVTGPHTITFAPRTGGEPRTVQVAGNVLLWQRGDLTLRLESALGLPAALEVATSAP